MHRSAGSGNSSHAALASSNGLAAVRLPGPCEQCRKRPLHDFQVSDRCLKRSSYHDTPVLTTEHGSTWRQAGKFSPFRFSTIISFGTQSGIYILRPRSVDPCHFGSPPSLQSRATSISTLHSQGHVTLQLHSLLGMTIHFHVKVGLTITADRKTIRRGLLPDRCGCCHILLARRLCFRAS